MITGEIKTKIDQIWDTFHVSGITNPITVLEQMTYIFFMKMGSITNRVGNQV